MRLPPEIEARVVPKFDWIRLLDRAAPGSVLYTHELCGNRCERVDKKRGYTSRLSAATIHHIAVTLALKADVDGTDAWLGVAHLAAKAKRDRVTVIAALKHLEAKELIHPHVRGGAEGIPRNWATIWVLTRPPAEVMAELAGDEEMSGAWKQYAGRHAK